MIHMNVQSTLGASVFSIMLLSGWKKRSTASYNLNLVKARLYTNKLFFLVSAPVH